MAVIEATPDPERVIWYCMHQDYSAGFSLDDPLPDSYGDALVRHLLNKSHYGPFEHPQISCNVGGVSRVLLAQVTRHRVGITFDVQSLRYTRIEEASPDERDFVFPPTITQDKVRERYQRSRQLERPADELRALYSGVYRHALEAYRELLAAGVPAEDARMVIPQGVRINLTMSVNARALMHLLDMRLPANAQWEIRELGEVLLAIAEEWMPHTFAWYRENRAFKHRLAP